MEEKNEGRRGTERKEESKEGKREVERDREREGGKHRRHVGDKK